MWSRNATQPPSERTLDSLTWPENVFALEPLSFTVPNPKVGLPGPSARLPEPEMTPDKVTDAPFSGEAVNIRPFNSIGPLM
jgi:hypothetical protein